MTDKWFSDMHDKMDSFELPEPEGLWHSVESGINSVPPRRPFLIWKRVAAVAAVLAAIVVTYVVVLIDGGMHDLNPDEPLRPGSDMLAFGVDAENPDNSVVTSPETKSLLNSNGPVSSQVAPSSVVSRCETNASATNEVSNSIFAPESSSSAGDADKTAPSADNPSRPSAETGRNDSDPGVHSYDHSSDSFLSDTGQNLRRDAQKSSTSGCWSVEAFTSGGVGASATTSLHPVRYSALSSWSDIRQFEYSRPLKSRAQAGADHARYNMNHHMPLRFGLSVAYAFSSRLSLRSGITYTLLRSDVSDKTSPDPVSGQQVLHYLGIPLDLNCRIASWRSFSVYASAGVLAQKNVSGSLKTHTVVNGEVGIERKTSLSESDLRWALTLSAGAQYSISPLIAVYAEPGVSYNFDSNSPLRTVYDDRPFSFDINIGLRFNLNSK